MKNKKCRCKKCIAFRKNNDFEYLDVFGLYHHLAEDIYPKLEAFRNDTYSYPHELTLRKWKVILNKMIFAFKTISKGERKSKNYKRIKEGLDLFSEYFCDLWI